MYKRTIATTTSTINIGTTTKPKTIAKTATSFNSFLVLFMATTLSAFVIPTIHGDEDILYGGSINESRKKTCLTIDSWDVRKDSYAYGALDVFCNLYDCCTDNTACQDWPDGARITI